MREQIIQILKEKLSATYVEVWDETALHAGHPEAVQFGGGHYNVLVVSEQFAGQRLIERHRMVYQALKEQLKEDIHALAITALTKNEYKAKSTHYGLE